LTTGHTGLKIINNSIDCTGHTGLKIINNSIDSTGHTGLKIINNSIDCTRHTGCYSFVMSFKILILRYRSSYDIETMEILGKSNRQYFFLCKVLFKLNPSNGIKQDFV
jgi:hypothetical protein